MIIYNITTKVSLAIETAWLHWQKNEHIPEIMKTGFFSSYTLFHLLEQDDTEGKTFIIQFSAIDMQHYQRYINEFATPLRQKAFERWGNQFLSFRSILQVMH